MGARTYSVRLKPGAEPNKFVVEMSDKPITVSLRQVGGQAVELSFEGETISYQRPSPALGSTPQKSAQVQVDKGTLVSPMPGRVITVLAQEGQRAHPGEPLVVIESMKMEVAIRSDREGTVERIMVSEGASVKRGQPLVSFLG